MHSTLTREIPANTRVKPFSGCLPRQFLALCLVCLVGLHAVTGVAAEQTFSPLPSLALVDKPEDTLPERRARTQPAVPSGFRHIAYVPDNPRPDLTPEELDRGFMIFRRPVAEPVYVQTRPYPEDRIESLDAFATPGEFAPLTFTLYPSRQLRNLRVRASELRGPDGTIPAENIDLRLVTYWNIRYPRYNARNTYRNMPELLESVTVHTSPAGQCQRYWITVRVPDDAGPGIYRGAVTIWDDAFDRAVSLPVRFRVLPFRLRRDPNKQYSAYVYDINREFDEHMGRFSDRARQGGREWVERAAANEYRAMAEHGFTTMPTLYYAFDPYRKELYFPNEDFIFRETQRTGLGGPGLVVNVGARDLYEQATGQRMRNHAVIPTPPPDSFYDEVRDVVAKLEARRKEKGWPEFIYAPLDEVHGSSTEFAVQVYRSLKELGVRTYATKTPTRAEAEAYMPYVDFWCSQPYAVPYEQTVASERHGYWTYPNHNANEDRVPEIMCMGGRMTYGFGYWRSGYTMIVPWAWRWRFGESFNFLDGNASNIGNDFDEDGNVVPTTYWQCFREGVDDLGYIYTLQAAVEERRGLDDPRCRTLVGEALAFLQETWDSIPVMARYRDRGLWPPEQFEALRWRAADLTTRLMAFPGAEARTPSVIVPDTTPKPDPDAFDAWLDTLPADRLETVAAWDHNFSDWRGSSELSVSTVEYPACSHGRCMRLDIDVDYFSGEGPGRDQNLIGWPRARTRRLSQPVNIQDTDFYTLRIRIESNRKGSGLQYTPMLMRFGVGGATGDLSLGGMIEEGQWFRFVVSADEILDAVPTRTSTALNFLQIWCNEADYEHGTQIVVHVDDIAFMRFTHPVVRRVDVAADLVLPANAIAFDPVIPGLRPGTERGAYTLTAKLRTEDGAALASQDFDPAAPGRSALPLPAIEPGRYVFNCAIADREGAVLSEWSTSLTAVAGPFHE